MAKSSRRKSVVIERIDKVDNLPGWTMELKSRKKGKRTDPYYKDPLNGYLFRSKKDALRYLQTGDPGKYAIIPKEEHTISLGESVDGALSASTVKEQEVNDNLANGQLLTGQCFELDVDVNDDLILEPSSAGVCQATTPEAVPEAESSVILTETNYTEHEVLDAIMKWDPCIEFSYKLLTGEISLDDEILK